MILSTLQAISCAALAASAIRWRLAHGPQANAYRFLLPYSAAAAIFGIALVYPLAMELFIAHYSGAIFEMEVMEFRFNGPYWWAYCAGFIFPLLPILGVIPVVGRRPIVMAILALVAAIPVSFWRIGEFFW